MYRKIILMLTVLLFLFHSDSSASLFDNADEYVQVTVDGEINWSTMMIRAKGDNEDFLKDSSPKAADLTEEEAAINAARINLFETLKELALSSSYHVDDEIYIYEEANEKVTDIAFKAKVVGRPVKTEDGVTEAVVELKLTDGVLDVILPKKSTLPKGYDIVFQGRGMYSSIIFDATMTDLLPVLMPQVIDDAEKPYYSLDKINRPVAAKIGLVRYFKSIDAAKKSLFAGRKPYVIQRGKLDKYKEDTFVVQAPMLNKVRNEAIISEILGKCKVIFIIK